MVIFELLNARNRWKPTALAAGPFGNWGTAISASVQLFRQPVGERVGVRAEARWRPAGGLGAGSGMLLDVHGEIGRVSTSVIPEPFPQARARGPRQSRPQIPPPIPTQSPNNAASPVSTACHGVSRIQVNVT